MVKAQEQKTILITGGAGFIGSHLCEKYLAEGNRVMCVDNLQTTQTTKHIGHLLAHPRFRFMRHDIIEPFWIGEKLDWIFNFACSGSYTSYQYDPIHTLKTSTIGLMHMLDLARKNNARIMQASTSEIYGDPLESPQKEIHNGNVNPLGPRACYDEGKRAGETLCMDYYRQYDVDVKIIRIFNTYGPNMDLNDGRAVTNFIVNALDGKDLVVYGDGTHTRSFQYIDDLIRGIDLMMRKDNFIGPVNLGNPDTEMNMKEFAEYIVKATHSQSRIVFKDKATDDPRRRRPDITRAKTELHWEPKIPLKEGLQETVAYFRNVERADQKIVVFATTYYPDHGPAEKALYELSESLPGTEFHVVTTKFRSGRKSYEVHRNNHIYRIGIGNRFDKYLLPFLGTFKAYQLSKQNRYRFMWSIMASYGGISALILKWLVPHVNFLITLDEKEFGRKSKSRYLPVYRFILKHSDALYVSSDEQENIIRKLVPGAQVSKRNQGGIEFMNQIQHMYMLLINKQGKKLLRPR